MTEVGVQNNAVTAPVQALRQIGVIAFVQIQERSLKNEVNGTRHYDPAPLLRVDSLELSPDGIVGVLGDGKIMDIHNRTHPHTKSWGEVASISLGFTSHYERIRERFGAWMYTGIAGENIIVDSKEVFALGELGPLLELRRPDGSATARLVKVVVAGPCEPFSRFAGGPAQTPEQIKATLQFLHRGMRGYYACLDGDTGVVRPGDLVFGSTMP